MANIDNNKKKIDPVPDQFATPDEAGDFWDSHSVADYQKILEPTDLECQISHRHFEIEVDEQSFQALCHRAKEKQTPVKELASEILKRQLAVG